MTHDEKAMERAFEAYRKTACWSIVPANHTDAIRAAITAYQAEAWQDISTAPKDGTRVLVWFSYSAEERARARVLGREEAARWSVHCGAWMLDHDACDEGHAPSHWQPLPNPPASP